MKKQPAAPKSPKVGNDPQARKEAERAETALKNVRQRYDGAATNPPDIGLQGGPRDTSSKRRTSRP